MSRLKELKKPTLFMSGDRHLSEIIKVPLKTLGFESYEFTSSPMHSKVYPGAFKKNPSPHQVAGIDGQWNYMIFDIENHKTLVSIKVEDFGLNNQLFFSKKFKIPIQ